MLNRSDLQAHLESADRKWGHEDLYYFTRFCLDYSLLQQDPHQQVCRFAQEIVQVHKKGLDLEPRGTFKTTIFSQALPIWLVEHNPNIRILLDGPVLQNSVDNLRVIKSHFKSPKFQFLFGDFVGAYWVEEEITVSRRTRVDLKEPTIRCASTERVQVGPHYDVIIADDLVSKDNSETPEQRQKIKEHFKLLFSLLEPDGILIVIGTRWHYDDLYGMILDVDADTGLRLYPEFATRVKSARKDGKLYFKERLSAGFLDERESKDRDIFNCQYQNDPAPQDAKSNFQRENFQYYKDLPNPKLSFITIDPGGNKSGSDPWVMMALHCGEAPNIYFDKMMKGNWKQSEAWDHLFMLVDDIQPLTVALETTGTQHYLEESLRDEMRIRNKFFNLVCLTHAGDSKASRILKLQPRYQSKSILHSRNMGALEDQLLRFPKGKDDIADAAAMGLEICSWVRSSKRAKVVVRSLDDMIWEAARPTKTRMVKHSVLGDQC